MSNPFPRPLILGHRGSPLEATENTLRSLSLALRHGADGVELDVQRSRDGVPVVIHDDSLDRTMTARGRVSRLTWGAIEKMTAARVPSFDQATAWAAASGAWLNVEIKARGVEEAVLSLLDERGLRDRSVISSFDYGIVHRVGEVGPHFRRFLLTERWNERARSELEACGASGVCLRVDAATPAALADLAERDLPVVVWTVNEPARMEELLRAGVAAIITDDPAAGVRARAQLGLA